MRPVIIGFSIAVAQSSLPAATWQASSPTVTAITAAINQAANGDTVIVPAGTASWTKTLVVTKGITLKGATTTNTSTGTVQDRTIILDNVPRMGLNAPIVSCKVPANQGFRLTGFTFSGSLTNKSDGAVIISGTSPSIRLDHCHFDRIYTAHNLEIFGWLFGVIDHCIFDIQQLQQGNSTTAFFTHATWGNQPSGWGSWADPPYFGSEKFIFFEDNLVTNHGKTPNSGSLDAARGGRYVARHNRFNNAAIYFHGSDTGAGEAHLRGTRAVEIYNNTFHSSLPAQPGGQCRGGSLLWHDNTYTGTYSNGMALKVYRLFQGAGSAQGWGNANGTNPWDYNATEPNGTHVNGHPPYLFATGTHKGLNGAKVVLVSGTPWTPNRWAGYSVTNTSANSPYYGACSYITSSTSNTLILGNIGDPSGAKFNTGDTFAIYKVLIVLDQPGRGQGDLIIGKPSGSTSLTGTTWPEWPSQVSEPCYAWNNKLNGSNIMWSVSDGGRNILRENVDFYNNTPKPGYTPYVYPHPLNH